MSWSSTPVAASSLPAAQPGDHRATACCSRSGVVVAPTAQRRLRQRRGEEEVVGLVELGQRADVVVDVLQRPQQRQHAGGAAELGDRQRVGLEVAVRRAEPLLHVGDLAVELGEPDGEEVAGQRLVVVRRRDLLDLVARARPAASRRASTAATASGSGLALIADEDGVADPQRAGARAGSARRTGIGVPGALVAARAGPAPMIASSRRGAVAHGARHHALGDHPEHHLAGLRAVGAEAAAGLQADQPVAGGRDPDRAAAVVGARRRDDARRDRRARPARRAAGRVAEVPRVARRPPAARAR